MTRDGVVGSGSSIGMPKPLRNASIVRIAPSIQNDATSLIADIAGHLRVLRAGPSGKYRDLPGAGLGRSVSVGAVDDRLPHCFSKFARVVSISVSFDHGRAQLLAKPADIGPHRRDLRPGWKTDRRPPRREYRAGHRSVESLPAEHQVDRGAEHLSDRGVAEHPIGRLLGDSDH